MITVSLPKLPKGKEFEEFISAYLNASGYYIERNIVERKAEEILELDIIATDYKPTAAALSLLEIKSGDWGFSDLFKLRGWLDYLGMPGGGLVVREGATDLHAQIAAKLGLQLAQVLNLGRAQDALATVMPLAGSVSDVAPWRWSYWIERNLINRLRAKKKTQPDRKCYEAGDRYLFEINSEIFFVSTPIGRVDRLYDLFQKYARLSARTGHELLGGDFENEDVHIPRDIFKETYYDCKYTDIQLSAYIEHRARLAVLKSTVDYKLLKDSATAVEEPGGIRVGKIVIPRFHLLPANFQSAFTELSKHKYLHRYPVLWQWFLWVFGGFILKDYEEQEYRLLAEKAGLPVEEVPRALTAYDILFPRDGGWFVDASPYSNVKLLQVFSVPFRGLGANYRRWRYSKTGKWEDLKLGGTYTMVDLLRWNALIVQVLQ